MAGLGFLAHPSLLASSVLWKVDQHWLWLRAAGTRFWQKTVLGKSGTTTDLDVVALAYIAPALILNTVVAFRFLLLCCVCCALWPPTCRDNAAATWCFW